MHPFHRHEKASYAQPLVFDDGKTDSEAITAAIRLVKSNTDSLNSHATGSHYTQDGLPP
ncbi:uncharacterized protein PHALS_07369 [Plasmopara halstedii]|uniref:Uncharacterized protein n=1 Tax=Plasmopara halstedii TaxID=4781 RepID=A0A0P1B5C2_PLAHL|nr:uncharacterized protein PHALS_07369 [Plasmopara halstedii]CEG49614.1 hypothetical protein PHALS_07369 [Plasmopara halstedii]|eukprot:XP_024585983.1 hypothetical protein PHALS_07369 [Plasmopara halstedii]